MNRKPKIVSSTELDRYCLFRRFNICAAERNAARKASSRLNRSLTEQLPGYRGEREGPARLSQVSEGFSHRRPLPWRANVWDFFF